MSYLRDTLVLLGHGSTVNADSAAPTLQHADTLRDRGIFGQVLTAFWKQEPSICGVLRGAFGERVFLVPNFISEGYFTEEVLPRELGFPWPVQEFPAIRFREQQALVYCGPVGTHPSMTEVLLSRAREVVGQAPPPANAPPSLPPRSSSRAMEPATTKIPAGLSSIRWL